MTMRPAYGSNGSDVIRALLLALAALLSGCALDNIRIHQAPPRFMAAGDLAAECAQFLARLDRETAAAGVADGQDARIAGFPYLRINRFLAGDWRPGPDAPAFAFWVQELRRLDSTARFFEISNRFASEQIPDHYGANSPAALHQRTERCAVLLMARDQKDSNAWNRLHQSAVVPDDYRLFHRVAGLYPLTSIPFLAGVKRLHDVIRRDFAPPLHSLPLSGRLVRYAPGTGPSMSAAEIAALIRRAGGHPLGLPTPSVEERTRLFQTFAPIFEIDVAGDDDRIGSPRLASDGLPSVAITKPAVFTYTSHARFESRTLLQLNYVVWFPSRPSTGSLDILAGRLDGINWRVTLDADGTPLLYDSMHNCGCYHLFIPSEKLRLAATGDKFEEPVLVPQTVPSSLKRLVVRIASRTHYVQRAYFDHAKDVENYLLADYDELRSLDVENLRRRSLFSDNGLVRGTERAERWLFWPMGIESPGAMRQRGRHATAFVGRRHFDDPLLISRYFRRDRR